MPSRFHEPSRALRVGRAVGVAALLGAGVVLSFAGPAARAYVRARAQAHAGMRVSHRHAPTSAGARDRAATRTYIDANYRLVRDARANLAASEGAIRALVVRLVGECPLAGEGSYVNDAASQVSEEVIGSIVATAYKPDVAAIHAFTRSVAHLRWSDRRLTRIVHAYVVKLENLAALGPAAVCEDVRAFAAAGFRTAPEATLRYDQLYFAADIEAEEVPLRLLAPYEEARGAALLRNTQRLAKRRSPKPKPKPSKSGCGSCAGSGSAFEGSGALDAARAGRRLNFSLPPE